MSEQIDIAVDLGVDLAVVAPPLSEIMNLRQLVEVAPAPPPQIIDSAGKSLHGWFDAPRNKLLESRLKVGLETFGCDPKVFTYSQPVRVPGAWRDGKLQRLVWLRE